MTLAPVNKEYNTFVRGLITEANPLTYPENASLDEDNFELKRDGSRSRRLGVDYESGYSLIDTGKLTEDLKVISIHEWRNVNNNPDKGILAIQVDSDFWFFDLFATDWTSPTAQLNGGVPLNDASNFLWKVFNINREREGTSMIPFNSVEIEGKLILATGSPWVIQLTYSETTDTIEASGFELEVRDQWGVEEPRARSDFEFPDELVQEHEYNLLNQGWSFEWVKGAGQSIQRDDPPYKYYFDKEDHYPSNAQLPALGKTADNLFDPKLLRTVAFGSAVAPRGRIILRLFERGESRVGLTRTVNQLFYNNLLSTSEPYLTLPVDRTDGGVTVLGAFEGRLFFSGFTGETIDGDSKSPLLSTMVAFSRIIETPKDFGKCYSEADPTSEEDSELADSDGGLIQIPEMGRCLKMIAVGRGLLLFSSNGIWEISGGESNFTATNFQVSKLTEIGPSSVGSIVEAEGAIYYWAKGGIYSLAPNELGKMAPQNISETTIQTLFNDIPSLNRQRVSGAYDPASKKLQWLYSDNSAIDPAGFLTQYNKLLTLDLVLGSFSVKTFGSLATNSPVIADLAITPETIAGKLLSAVIVGVDKVTEKPTANVVINSTYAQNSVTRTKYLTLLPNTEPVTSKFTFSSEQDAEFLDWKGADSVGIDAPAFMEAGYEILEDTQRDKYIQYLTTHFNRTDTNFTTTDGGLNYTSDTPSGCLMEVKYDFTDSSASGKWTAPTQAYRLNRNFIVDSGDGLFDYGHNVVSNKHKVRGRGKAVRVKFSTEPGKDCQLLGWGAQYIGLTAV